jgi:predicted nuclease of predicted toxin-antitoxin system
MDVHVHDAITEALRSSGADVLTSQEDGTRQFEDSDLVDRATALGRVLFSQDRDMLREGSKRQRLGEPFTGVIYAHRLKVSVGQCIHDLELIALAGEADEFANTVLYLPFR